MNKIKMLIMLTIMLPAALSYAVLQQNIPMTITQPDGGSFECYASGDEFFNYLHDEEGYTIIQHEINGFYYYAEKIGEKISASEYLVGSINPAATDFSPKVIISQAEYNRKKTRYFQNEIPNRAPSEGVMNNLVVYISFSDQAEFGTPRSEFDVLFNDSTGTTESVYDYYQEASYEALEVESHHFPVCDLSVNLSYHDEHPRGYYSAYNATTNPIGYQNYDEVIFREHTLLVNAVNFIEEQVPLEMELDADDDGLLDSIGFIIRGGNNAWADLLWAHRWFLFSQDADIHGNQVWDYTFQPESQVDTYTLCHELFHLLGAPDLYRYETNGSPYTAWDLMSSSFTHMSAYMKYRYGNWIDEIPVITESGLYTLNPLTEPYNNCFKILSPNSQTEYFVVEYRKRVPGTYEMNIPGSGLTITRVNTEKDGEGNAGGPPDELYIFRQGGTPSYDGNVGASHFTSDIGRTSFSDSTDPYGFLSDGTLGGIFINDVGTAGETISFVLDPQQGMIMGDISSENTEIDVAETEIILGTEVFHPDTEGGYYIMYYQGTYEMEVSLHGHATQYQSLLLEPFAVLEYDFVLDYLNKPTNLQYSYSEEETQLTLTWDFDAFDDEDFENFDIYTSINGDYFTYIGSSDENIYHRPYPSNLELYFYVKAIYSTGISDPSETIQAIVTDASDDIVGVAKLIGNYPNPFNPSTTISFNLKSEPGNDASIEIFNLKGQNIRQYSILNNQTSVNWDGKDNFGNSVSSGLYFYKLKAGNFSDTKKMILMK